MEKGNVRKSVDAVASHSVRTLKHSSVNILLELQEPLEWKKLWKTDFISLSVNMF